MKRRCIQDNFWSAVDQSGGPDACWPWKAARGKDGYGHVRWDGKVSYAHRIAYMLTYGDPGDLCVLHRCDNHPCCNPSHHFKGTYNDNNQDKKSKGRAPRMPGESNPAAVLTWDKVREIRRLYHEQGHTQTGLAQIHGVTQALIWLIVHNKKWVE